jgi:hypothetical protein
VSAKHLSMGVERAETSSITPPSFPPLSSHSVSTRTWSASLRHGEDRDGGVREFDEERDAAAGERGGDGGR